MYMKKWENSLFPGFQKGQFDHKVFDRKFHPKLRLSNPGHGGVAQSALTMASASSHVSGVSLPYMVAIDHPI